MSALGNRYEKKWEERKRFYTTTPITASDFLFARIFVLVQCFLSHDLIEVSLNYRKKNFGIFRIRNRNELEFSFGVGVGTGIKKKNFPESELESELEKKQKSESELESE